MANRSIHQRRQTQSILPATGESLCPAGEKKHKKQTKVTKVTKVTKGQSTEAEHVAGPSSTLADAES